MTVREASKYFLKEFTGTGEEIATLILSFVAAGVANAGGVGGGPLFMPLLELVLRFPLRESTNLSQTMVGIAGIASCTFFFTKRHPKHKNETITDYKIVLLLLPMLLVGVMVGLILNSVLPLWLIQLILVGLMFFQAQKGYVKSVSLWKKETKEMEKARAKAAESAAAAQVPPPPPASPTPPDQPASAYTTEKTTDEPSTSAHNPTATVTVESAAPSKPEPTKPTPPAAAQGRLPLRKLLPLELWEATAFWVCFMLLQFGKSRMKACSGGGGAIIAIQILLGFAGTVFFMWQTVGFKNPEPPSADEAEKGAAAVAAADDDKKAFRDWKNVTRSCSFALLAGLIAGITGLGGGMVINPLLIEFGMQPQVASATSMVLVAFSGVTAGLTSLMLKRLPIIFAGILGGAVFTGSYAGVFVIAKGIQRTGRPSLIVILLAITMAATGVIVLAVGIYDSVKRIQKDKHMGFFSFCDT